MNIADTEKELIERNIRIGESERLRDEDFLNAVLANDFIFRRADGEVVNKEKYLADLRNPNNTFEYLISDDLKATVFEGVAVVTLRVRAKGKHEIISFEGTYRDIRLFLKNQEWTLVVGTFLVGMSLPIFSGP
jgi:hypothetical protein